MTHKGIPSNGKFIANNAVFGITKKNDDFSQLMVANPLNPTNPLDENEFLFFLNVV